MDIFDLMELRFPEKHGTIIRYRNASGQTGSGQREDDRRHSRGMVDICRVGDIGMESAVNEMKPYLTTQRLLEKFLLLYTELHNTTRMPENYGHTPEELFESERIRRVVGRNDPCPCGSGKKYKKCCGRNVN